MLLPMFENPLKCSCKYIGIIPEQTFKFWITFRKKFFLKFLYPPLFLLVQPNLNNSPPILWMWGYSPHGAMQFLWLCGLVITRTKKGGIVRRITTINHPKYGKTTFR